MFPYSTIEEALEELRQGRMILCTDDPDRENEGDLICAAQLATTENVNFMATHAKGLICTPMSAEIADRLGLEQMVKVNTDNHATAFTVSIDHVDTTTGISAEERGYTCRKCVDPDTRPEDLRRPGHVFPLTARRGGVLVLPLSGRCRPWRWSPSPRCTVAGRGMLLPCTTGRCHPGGPA